MNVLFRFPTDEAALEVAFDVPSLPRANEIVEIPGPHPHKIEGLWYVSQVWWTRNIATDCLFPRVLMGRVSTEKLADSR